MISNPFFLFNLNASAGVLPASRCAVNRVDPNLSGKLKPRGETSAVPCQQKFMRRLSRGG
jgi:hypothetical protein